MKPTLALCLLLTLSVSAWATSYSTPSPITQMTAGSGFIRVKTQSMTAAESCAKQEWYVLDISDGTANAMYSLLLAAKA